MNELCIWLQYKAMARTAKEQYELVLRLRLTVSNAVMLQKRARQAGLGLDWAGRGA